MVNKSNIQLKIPSTHTHDNIKNNSQFKFACLLSAILAQVGHFLLKFIQWLSKILWLGDDVTTSCFAIVSATGLLVCMNKVKVEDQLERISKWMVPDLPALGTENCSYTRFISYADLVCSMNCIAVAFICDKMNFSKNQWVEWNNTELTESINGHLQGCSLQIGFPKNFSNMKCKNCMERMTVQL